MISWDGFGRMGVRNSSLGCVSAARPEAIQSEHCALKPWTRISWKPNPIREFLGLSRQFLFCLSNSACALDGGILCFEKQFIARRVQMAKPPSIVQVIAWDLILHPRGIHSTVDRSSPIRGYSRTATRTRYDLSPESSLNPGEFMIRSEIERAASRKDYIHTKSFKLVPNLL